MYQHTFCEGNCCTNIRNRNVVIPIPHILAENDGKNKIVNNSDDKEVKMLQTI